MGLSLSTALSGVTAAGLFVATCYTIERYQISPFNEAAHHPLMSIGQWFQRQLYPFEMTSEDFVLAARRSTVNDPATMPAPATPCSTVWRTPLGYFLFNSAQYQSTHQPTAPGKRTWTDEEKKIITPGSARSADGPRLTYVAKLSPPIKGANGKISMKQYIIRRVFGDKTPKVDGTVYNEEVFRHGSPYQRAYDRFQGYYAITIGGREIPFLPPALQPLPLVFGTKSTQWDGFLALSSETNIRQLEQEGAWHWVNLQQLPRYYYTQTESDGVDRREIKGENARAFNQVERDIMTLGMKAYDFVCYGKTNEAATMEWYPVTGLKTNLQGNRERGFDLVNDCTSSNQYLEFAKWSEAHMRTYIRTFLNWNPDQIKYIQF